MNDVIGAIVGLLLLLAWFWIIAVVNMKGGGHP